MAFDGITVANITWELSNKLTGGRIVKIAQPEKEEIILTIKNNGGQYRLLMSAEASLPLLYLTSENKPSPLTAPNFCMVLRKHLQNAKILSVSQPGLERVVKMECEHLDEMGDLCKRTLIIEIMGKYSNLIFCDEKDTIIDSLKHISGMISSVREVLPQRKYFIPDQACKKNPLCTDKEEFVQEILHSNLPVYKAIYQSYMGISPFIANEICYVSNVDASRPSQSLEQGQLSVLFDMFYRYMSQIKEAKFNPTIVYENNIPKEYAAIGISSYPSDMCKHYESISELLYDYYSQKNKITCIRQKSADLRRIVSTILERDYKKLDLQLKQEQDASQREKYRVYGELLNTYGYSTPDGSKSAKVFNYYDNEQISIPLDERLTIKENAQKYFDKYGKMKRTSQAVAEQLAQTKASIEYLESIQTFLEIALSTDDLEQIREELCENGFIKKRFDKKKKRSQSKPLHYKFGSEFDLYVGKNNIQNEELTFKFANGNDWWFHAKGVPGSHVIVKQAKEKEAKEWDMPNEVFEAAAALAAHYSKAANQEKAEIDYTRKKNVKHPSGAKAGFVVYYTNYSMVIDSDISNKGIILQ